MKILVTDIEKAFFFGFSNQIAFMRWFVLTANGRILPRYAIRTNDVGALDYSQQAFNSYQPHKRIRYLYFLLAGFPRQTEGDLLIIGPRFENEFYLARGLGWSPDCIFGIDLLAYSKKVTMGDMHSMPFDKNTFKSVVCGWTISYSWNPQLASSEINRVLKPGGLVVFGVNIVPDNYEVELDVPTKTNRIQTTAQFQQLLPNYEVLAHTANDGEGIFLIVLKKPYTD
jgi:SAM-dependent methyltransferase